MAILKKSQVSGSLMIGSGSEATQWYEDDNSGSQYGQPYVSSPMYTGSGFAFRQGYQNTIPLGYYPVNSNLAGKNIKETLETAFNFAQPTVVPNSTGTWTITGNNVDFIVPAMSTTKTVHWNENYQMPAKMSSSILTFSYSGYTFKYNQPDSIAWNNEDTSNYITYSVLSTYMANLYTPEANKLYFMRNDNKNSYEGLTCTYSVPENDSGINYASYAPKLDITRPTTSNIKDILGNPVSVTLTDKSSATISNVAADYRKYGYRFFIVRKDGNGGNQFKSIKIAGNLLSPQGSWTDYSTAFSNSTVGLSRYETGLQKDWVFNKTIWGTVNDTSQEAPSCVFAIAYSDNDMYDPAIGGRLGVNAGNRHHCWTLAAQPGAGLVTATQMGFLNNSWSGDILSALSSNTGAFTKTWPNGLTSNMKVYYLTRYTDVQTVNILGNYYG